MIEFKGIEKKYQQFTAVNKLDLVIPDGQFTCIIGTSGSGKTTLLRMINKMIQPTSGKILINGIETEEIEDYKLRRQIGYVIQNIGLFPNMTIRENILIVPKLLKWPVTQLEGLAEKLIQKVDLDISLLDRYPSSLSGGQKQRIGVIRALAANQEIILLDEPFGALDPITRKGLQKLIKKIQHEMKKTVVFVTHDMEEALELSDKIIVMHKGELVQYDSPENIVSHPKNDFVRELIGKNIVEENIKKSLTVKDLMIKEVASITGNRPVFHAIRRMSHQSVDTLLVVDDFNHLVGYIDGLDIKEPLDKNIKISDVMKVESGAVNQNDLIVNIIAPLLNGKLKYRPVIDDENKLVGIVRRADIVSLIYKQLR